MCGFVVDVNKPCFKVDAKFVLATIKHRGPDDSGFFEDSTIRMFHTRLSIIGLTTGAQPMSLDSRYTITFNGEIYNYKELRKQYFSPHEFNTDSDTEVVLKMFIKFGPSCVKKFRGMYSFVIYDAEKQEVFVSRDPFGEKPLYIYKDGSRYIFASELKSITEGYEVDLTLNESALVHYLQHLHVGGGRSIYNEVTPINPGTGLVIDLKSNLVEELCFNEQISQCNDSYEEAKEKVRSLFLQSMKRQLVADVPVAVLLSGGVDSSIIASQANLLGVDLQGYVMGFRNRNEFEFAEYTAKRNGMKLSRQIVGESSICDLIEKMCGVYDEPFADSSNIPTYLISQYVSEDYKVVLGGDGADELFGGYDFWLEPYAESLKKHFFKYGSVRRYKVSKSYFSNKEIKAMGLNENRDSAFPVFDSNNLLLEDVKDYLPGDILKKTDMASMANSLEVRSPFLDYDFANYAMGLPYDYKVKDGKYKCVLKDAFKELLGEKIYSREKQGFGSPVHRWLQMDGVKMMVQELLLSGTPILSQYLKYEVVKKIASRFNYQTWILLCLEIWLRANRVETRV